MVVSGSFAHESDGNRPDDTKAGPEQCRLNACPGGHRAPERAPGSQTALKHQHEDREYPRPHPVGSQALYQRADQGNEHDPGRTGNQHRRGEQRHRVVRGDN